MNMHWLDWLIVGGLFLLLLYALVYCQRFVRSTADFLAANRCAGRYVLAISSGIAAVGAISIIASFQQYYVAGFTPDWWALLTGPIGLILSICGWVYYRFRETRCLTLAQLLEVRYSRKFRVFAGMLAWLAGLVNYGIFPAVSVKFFIYYCGIPSYYVGGVEVVYPLLMLFMLGLGAAFAISGGQISIMVTDFIQGVFCNIAFLVIMVFLFVTFSWSDIFDPILEYCRANPDASLVNPYSATQVPDFNIYFFLIGIFGMFYTSGVWQGSAGYNAAALSAHEAKMSRFLGTWRGMMQLMLFMFIPIVAFAVMHNPKFAALAGAVTRTLETVPDAQTQSQVLVPLMLVKVLPMGLVGIFAAVMFAAMLSTDNTYMHSWGSIFIQDVVMPFRKKPFSPKQHLLLLRLSIVMVGLFAFFFSWLFVQTEMILLFFQITGAIFSGGAGAVLIGGLYTRWGTTWGAWGAMIVGSGLATLGIVLQQIWAGTVAPYLSQVFPNWEYLQQNMDSFPLNGQLVFFCSCLAGIAVYVLLSLLERKVRKVGNFNLEKMLHRGQYAVEDNIAAQNREPASLLKLLGVTREFTRGDMFIFFMTMLWTFGWFALFLIVTVIACTVGLSDTHWMQFWKFKLVLSFVLGIITTVWFLIGGIVDISAMFRRLKAIRVDESDDGWVEKTDDAGK